MLRRGRRKKKNQNHRFDLACILMSTLILASMACSCSQKTERIQQARQFIQKWNYDRALTELISYRNCSDPEIQYLIGLCYIKKNEYDEAKSYFQISLDRDSIYRDSVIKIYNDLAQNALRINDPERALNMYQTIEELLPDHNQSKNLFLVADLNFSKGNYSQAVIAYDNAFARDSTSATAEKAMPNFIFALTECGDLERALDLAQIRYDDLKTAANLHQLNNIKYRIGQKLASAGLLDSALVYFTDVVNANEPKSLVDDAYYNIGEIYYFRKDYNTALDAYKRVLRLNPYEKGEIVAKAKNRIEEIKEKM